MDKDSLFHDAFEDEPVLFNTDDLEQIYSPLRMGSEPILSMPPRRKAKELRVEGPLTPPLVPNVPQKGKGISFLETMHEYIPELPSTYLDEDDLFNSSNDISAILTEQLQRYAETVEKTLEQDQLVEADSTTRVVVPQIEAIKPIPPWLQYSNSARARYPTPGTAWNAQMQLLTQIKTSDKILPQWHGTSKLERQLSWTPFPMSLASLKLDDSIEFPDELNHILEEIQLGNIVTSSHLTWKREGLRILDDAWDEDEVLLEKADHDGQEACLDALVMKKSILDATPKQRGQLEGHPATELSRMRHPATSENIPVECNSTTIEDDEAMEGPFSASSALALFLQSRGHLTPQPGSVAKHSLRNGSRKALPIPTIPSAVETQDNLIQNEPLSAANVVAPFPHPNSPPDPPFRAYIVSSELLTSNRVLMRHIQDLYPRAKFIERCFVASQSATNIPVAQQSISELAVMDEGDIILSPSTCLLLTTLQKLKQRPLPGQTSRLGIRERIATISPKFERLLVLVSDGSSTITNPSSILDDRDAWALADLQGFLTTLNTDAQAYLIPGDDHALAQWMVAAMCRYGVNPPTPEKQIVLQEETLWELFLRKAGLNAFAAQLILDDLKQTERSPDIGGDSVVRDAEMIDSRRSYGLATFLSVSPEERHHRFDSFLGGRRVLDRVNSVLEQRWASATGK